MGIVRDRRGREGRQARRVNVGAASPSAAERVIRYDDGFIVGHCAAPLGPSGTEDLSARLGYFRTPSGVLSEAEAFFAERGMDFEFQDDEKFVRFFAWMREQEILSKNHYLGLIYLDSRELRESVQDASPMSPPIQFFSR